MTEPKPFDLEKAKAGEAIMFRNGKPCKFIAHVPEAESCYKVVVLNCEHHNVVVRNENGEVLLGYQDQGDLVMAPKKRKVVVRLYQHNTHKGFHATASVGWLTPDWTLIKEFPVEVPE